MSTLSKKEFDNLVALAVTYYHTGDENTAGENYNQAFIKACKNSKIQHESLDTYYAVLNAVQNNDEKNAYSFKRLFIKKLCLDLQKDGVFLAISEIHEQVKELKSIWHFFNRQTKEIKDLKLLKKALLTINDGTIQEVIEKWQDSQNIIPNAFVQTLQSNYGAVSMETAIDRQIKRRALRPFTVYLDTRTSWFEKLITYLFRKPQLSEEKINLTRILVDEIKDFSGSSEKLKELLTERKAEHAQLSRDHHKNHFNLEEKRATIWKQGITRYECTIDPFTGAQGPINKYTSTYYVNDVREGELDSPSELASVFHRVDRLLSRSF